MNKSVLLVSLPLTLLAACSSGDDAAPADDAAATDAAPAAEAPAGEGDAMVAGTDYNATASVPCSFGGNAVEGGCMAGVKRGWGDDGGALVEITKPDGMKRAVFYDGGGQPMGADSSEADGSAAWDFMVTTNQDTRIIDYGPEHYEIPDAFITGG